MKTSDYINKPSDNCEVVALLDQLGAARIDEFGGLRTFDYPDKGVSIYFEEAGKLRTMFLYSEGRDSHRQSVLEIPNGLSFADDLAQVIRKLGQPQANGSMQSGRQWVRFEYSAYALHLEIEQRTSQISLVRVMIPNQS